MANNGVIRVVTAFVKRNSLLISLLIPLVGLTYTVYQGYRSTLNSEIIRVEERIKQTLQELGRPIISVVLTNASDILTDEMLAQLKNVPILVEIKHIKGETARKITIVFKSDVPIRGLKKFSSVEPYDVKIDASARQATLNIPEIRQSADLKFLVETERSAKIKFNFFADQGKLLESDEETAATEKADKLFEDELGAYKWFPLQKWMIGNRKYTVHRFAKLDSPIGSLIEEQGRTAKAIELLIYEEKLSRLKNDNFIKAAQRLIVPDLIHFMVVISILCLLAIPIIYHMSRRHYRLISSAIDKKPFKNGDGIVDVLKIMGAPDRISIAEDSKADGDLLLAFGARSILISLPSNDYYFNFIFKGHSLILIKDNIRNITISPLCQYR